MYRKSGLMGKGDRPKGLDYDLSEVPDLAVISGRNATGKTLLLDRLASNVKGRAKPIRINHSSLHDLNSKKYAYMTYRGRAHAYISDKLTGLKGKGRIVLIDDVSPILTDKEFHSIASRLKELHSKGIIARAAITLSDGGGFKVRAL
jgi:ABC-type cobalamin/Fe3+-siderophores transport system ATPase subunit